MTYQRLKFSIGMHIVPAELEKTSVTHTITAFKIFSILIKVMKWILSFILLHLKIDYEYEKARFLLALTQAKEILIYME